MVEEAKKGPVFGLRERERAIAARTLVGAPMRIVVATDGSRGGDAALRFAGRLAANGIAELEVVTIVTSSDGTSRNGEGREPAKRVLDVAARKLAQQHVTANFRCIKTRGSGAVPEAIAREAEKLRADLVVVGSEGRDTLSEWVLGGVALRLVYLSRRPVTVVRPPRRRKTA